MELKLTGRVQVARFEGIVSAGKDVDVLWAGGSLYVMKEKGKGHVVWTCTDSGIEFRKVAYDGRFIWATAARDNKWPLLVVMDPSSEKVWELTAADGVPQGTDEQLDSFRYAMEIAPLEPGKICAAGFFGRSWIAVITFDAKTGKSKVKVIHEAREAQDAKNKDQANQTQVAFQPSWLFTLRGSAEPSGKAVSRVVLGRGRGLNITNFDVCARPLTVDVDKPSVEVFADRVEPFPRPQSSFCAATTGDSVYMLAWDFKPNTKPSLVRISVPDVKPKTIIEALPVGSSGMFIHEKQIHIICEDLTKLKPGQGTVTALLPREWWAANIDGTNLRLVAKDVPYIRAIGFSSHYGLVCICESEKNKLPTLHAIEFPAPTPKK